MNLEDLGYNKHLEAINRDGIPGDFEVGRVIAEYKERYTVRTIHGEYQAEITGNLRYTATSREDFPAVGDWVELMVHDPDFAIIHKVLPRHSVIKRQAVSQTGEVQVIAANIDVAFIVQAVDRDFNMNRLERYLTLCHTSKVSPVILLTKTDLIPENRLTGLIEEIQKRIENVPVLAVSNKTLEGHNLLLETIEKGKTYCLLGSSGVGKSTLLNHLSGKTIMKTNAISDSTRKGKHTTSHREMFFLDNGSIIIDNPGMREVGIADTGGGLETTFDRIVSYAYTCQFKDCTHIHETGCAVLEALEKGEIDEKAYENYLKLRREKAHFESSVAQKRKKEKQFGKVLKNYKKYYAKK
ncbi:MAG: ribosome small subunit-dependent GTPase A [Fidelibacterota bacterium]